MRATNWVGDAVMSLPALQAIRERYPHAHIAILARPWVADLYAREPIADEVIRYTAPKGWKGLRAQLGVARDLRSKRFDTAILMQNAFEAALLAWLARIPERIGYDRDGRGWLLTKRIKAPPKRAPRRHERFFYLELLHRAGVIDSIPESEAIRLDGAAAARDAGQQRFAAANLGPNVVGVSPGAAYGGAKRWIPERFAEAAGEIASAIGADVALFGSASERELCGEIARRIPGRVRNFAGETSLGEFIELAAACSVFLTNDSGGMHIASALGVPTVAVFGATDEIATGPTGPLARVVRQPVECAPCLLRECPIDHRCMTRVSAQRVAAEAMELLK